MALTTVPVELANLDGAVTVNESSADVDFRVESNGNTHMIFVDAGSDHVNFGTSTDHGGVVNIQTTDNTVNLVLASTDTDTSEGPIMDFTRDAGNVPSDGDTMGVIRFRNDNTDLVMHNYATIETRTVDVSAGTEDGRLEITTVVAGTEGTSRMLLDSGETVFNDNSADLDFRVESNGKQYALFVDGGNDIIGIGTSVPSSYNANADNVVIYDASGHTGITIAGGTDDYGNIYFAQGTSGSDAYRGYIQYGHSATSDANYRDVMLFGTATLERLRIQSDGNIRMGGLNLSNLTGGMDGITLADDASVTISTAGKATVGGGLLVIYDQNGGESGLFRLQYGGPIAVSTASVYATTDTDGKYCVTGSGHATTFKNRYGSSRSFNIAVYGAGNFNYDTE